MRVHVRYDESRITRQRETAIKIGTALFALAALFLIMAVLDGKV